MQLLKKVKEYAIKHSRKLWYITILLLTTLYVYNYRYIVFDLSKMNAACVIFIVWIVLIISPFFSEMELLGVKFKKEVEKIKSDINGELCKIEQQISAITMHNSVNINNVLPTKQKMDEVTNLIIGNTDKVSSSDQIDLNGKEGIRQSSQNISDGEDSDKLPTKNHNKESEDLISRINDRHNSKMVQYSIAIKSIMFESCGHNYRGYNNMIDMANYLMGKGVIDNQFYDILLDISKISYRALDGEVISDDYIKYVEDLMPYIIEKLRSIRARISKGEGIRCNKCGFYVDVMPNGQCPNCGYTEDDY